MKHPDIEVLVEAFQQHRLPPSDWTHQAHLLVALWHTQRYPEAEALCLLRAGIITYNRAVGTPNNAERGYHETLTVFWVKNLLQFWQEIGTKTPLSEAAARLLNSPRADTQYPLSFYDRASLFSTAARASYLPPRVVPNSEE
jgi:hypothetical protein